MNIGEKLNMSEDYDYDIDSDDLDNYHKRNKSMEQIQGVVEYVGQKKAWSIKVSGEYYGCGFDKPACNEGDQVQFILEQNGQWKNVKKGTLEVIGTATQKAAAPTVTKGSSFQWDDRQKLICWQSARSSAIETVTKLVELGALKLGAKAANQRPLFDEMVQEYNEYYYLVNKEILNKEPTKTATKTSSVDDDIDQDGDDYE